MSGISSGGSDYAPKAGASSAFSEGDQGGHDEGMGKLSMGASGGTIPEK